MLPGSIQPRTLLLVVAAIVAAWVVARLAVRFASPRPADLGVCDGRLRACPASPNCVCSQGSDKDHEIAPLTFTGESAAARERLKNVVAGFSGVRLLTEQENYLHYEFTTRWMGFTDDVEFLFDPGANAIHCRSASRVGYSDLGANRRRIEAIRAAFVP